MKNYTAILEAILFACGEPIELERIATGLSLDMAAVREQLLAYQNQLTASDRGLTLLFLEDKVQLCTKNEYQQEVMAVAAVKKNAPLSPAAMEVLAVVAYNQPVTKSFVEQIRGVESGQIVNNLVEKGLLEERGRLNVPGRPISYGTTDLFLRSFGLSSLNELPQSASGEDNGTEEDDQLTIESAIADTSLTE